MGNDAQVSPLASIVNVCFSCLFCVFLLVDGVTTPTTSTQVFYISVSVCCIVIFLVAIILAIMHLHSMKRVEMEDRFVSLVCPSSERTRTSGRCSCLVSVTWESPVCPVFSAEVVSTERIISGWNQQFQLDIIQVAASRCVGYWT